MSKVEIINIKGEKVKDINLKDNVFIKQPNDAVLHNAIILAQASLRQGTHKTKTRSEVSGGGRKPYRQKGTGNARQGSIRATQWRGGGIVFGPQPRSYAKKQNKKERRLAIKSALSYKVLNKELRIVDNLEFKTPKTKEMLDVLSNLNILNNKVLVVLNELTENVCLAARNLANVKVISYDEVNVLDLVSADIMLVEENGLVKLEEVLSNE